MIDLMSGRVQAAITNMLTAAPLVRSGKIRALAVTSLQRTQAMPELPTVDESGIRGYELRSWYGMVAPKKIPSLLLQKINQSVGAVMSSAEVKERLAKDGAEAAPRNSPEQFRALIAADIVRWQSFLKTSGTKLN
jgi:tripartite-type tricarboxylate transporter receptor subunit TctC